jgi:hypothetical protein
VLTSDLPGVNPTALNGTILYYCLMTKRSGLGDSTELSRLGLSQSPPRIELGPPRRKLVVTVTGRAQVNTHHRIRFMCGQAEEGTLPAELRPEGYHCNDPRLPMSHHRVVSTRHRHQARRTNGGRSCSSVYQARRTNGGRSRSSVRITGGEVDEPNLFLNYLLSVFPVSRVTFFVVTLAWAHLITGLLDLGFFRPISGHDTVTPDKGA